MRTVAEIEGGAILIVMAGLIPALVYALVLR